ncbi:MAG TPA: PH domain-containing protein [Candidatus Saccharimonadales bacterium]|nr:PH domain-containing protein [Candidatus Saccharimonadales bacterium]
MVSKKEVTRQLKALGFNYMGWGRSEISELPHIILPDEEIYECVNGIYIGGFALLVATNIRVLLVDKKPLSFLTVEDMRYDMISEMDYSHRLFGADISISSGDKTLHFKSYNKPRLRKLIGHVQHCIADNKNKQSKHQDSQVSHLEQINKQLQAYLIAQHQYQMELQESLKADKEKIPELPSLPKPSNELADYLYAQSLLKAFNDEQKTQVENPAAFKVNEPSIEHQNNQPDLYEEGVKEVFGGGIKHGHNPFKSSASPSTNGVSYNINPSRIAFSKLPMALRDRRFGRTSSKLINLEQGSEYSL